MVSFLLVQDLAIQRRENLLNLFSRLFQNAFQDFNILRHSVPFFLRDSPTLCQVKFHTCDELEAYLAGLDSNYRGYAEYLGHIPAEVFAVPLYAGEKKNQPLYMLARKIERLERLTGNNMCFLGNNVRISHRPNDALFARHRVE